VSEGYRELFVTAGDGLRLFARDYGPPAGEALPVVCLPGLSRNSRDFHDLALALSLDPERPRRVLALDYRGRGRSGFDRDPARYDVKVELDDCLAVLAAAGVHEAVLVGTSRGGIITMALSAARPALIRGAVLNDVGPVIDPRGLVRIRGTLGKLPAPRSFAQGAEILKGVQGAGFPALDDADWEELARGTWREEAGRLVPDHDPALARTLDGVDVETPLPPFWPLFEGLRGVPVLVLRGAGSDILSAATLDAMARAHPGLEAVTVPGQGHAPLLRGEAVIGRIRAFVRRAEETERASAG
jgi:pimeloyl-ACP methyl ester carboxylesterase